MTRLKTLAVALSLLLSSAIHANATPMPLDGSWIVLDEYMSTGDFFSGGPWDWVSSHSVEFTITDYFVVTDKFEVYDNGVLAFTTPALADWDALGIGGPLVSPPWTSDPDVALASGFFSSAVYVFGAGAHSITIRDIDIPTTAHGEPFSDGTVAFRAVPEPSILALFGTMGGAWVLRYRRRRKTRDQL